MMNKEDLERANYITEGHNDMARRLEKDIKEAIKKAIADKKKLIDNNIIVFKDGHTEIRY